MARSTKADKARQLNAAHHLLQRGIRLPEAVRRLSREFDLSGRQAYQQRECVAKPRVEQKSAESTDFA